VLRIEAVAKENRARAEQLAQRQQNIEDQHHQHVQVCMVAALAHIFAEFSSEAGAWT